jgi:hypothetical protein
MKHILCKIVGHRDFSPATLAAKPWEDRDFNGYDREDFREVQCLRCGEPLMNDNPELVKAA